MAGKKGKVLDPRQIEFLKNYLNPKSDTFANAYQSAIKVGYSDNYSKQIMDVENEWITENNRIEHMVK
jgi:hypothetical protein